MQRHRSKVFGGGCGFVHSEPGLIQQDASEFKKKWKPGLPAHQFCYTLRSRMYYLKVFFADVHNYYGIFVTVVSFILTLVGTLTTFAAKRVGDKATEERSKGLKELRQRAAELVELLPANERPSKTPWKVARERVLIRLEEAASLRAEQRTVERWSKVAANFLTIAQYIIGGALASSFVQETLTPKWVGALGVLVLIASLFKQQFHPEINADNARRKTVKLQFLIRTSEDQLAILDAKAATGQDHSDAMIALMTVMTRMITEIESPEVTEFRPPS